MVQSTGPANAEYLCSLVFGRTKNNSGEYNKGQESHTRQLAFTHWAAATKFAIASTLSSVHNNLQKPSSKENKDFLDETKDAVTTLQEVLEGKHDEAIEETLTKYHVPTYRWWSTLHQVIEGKHNHDIIKVVKICFWFRTIGNYCLVPLCFVCFNYCIFEIPMLQPL